MPKAFVLINVELDGGKEVIEALKAIEEVKEAYPLYGVYDVIARVESETEQELKKIISNDIRRLNKVRSTMTMIAL
jgi:DNA-binding Lrp family transcriptional regulator